MNYRYLHKSAGLALVTAIFLLVVLAGLGVAVVSLTTSQQASSIQDLQGGRAYQAAKAGLEWGLYQALQSGGGTPAANLNCANAANSYSFAMPAGTSLSAFTVTVTCTAAAAALGDGTANDPTAGHFRLTATACNQPTAANACPNPAPGNDYVQRVITSQL
jgi:MSHA biogenesis protein MshP